MSAVAPQRDRETNFQRRDLYLVSTDAARRNSLARSVRSPISIGLKALSPGHLTITSIEYKENAGIASLPRLDEEGIMAAAVDRMSARIGDGEDAYESGRISRVNEKAAEAGVEVGMSTKEAAMRMLRHGQ